MDRRTKQVALVVGGVIALVVLGLVGAVLGSEASKERRAGAGPSPEATITLVDCPWGEASCVLALGIERALQAGNVDAVVGFSQPHFYICPGGEPSGLGEPFPLCNGADEFVGREGYPIARRYSEASVVDEASLHRLLSDFLATINPEAEDEIGGGGLHLYAFGCPELAIPFQNVSCARLAIILSAILGEGNEQHRELLVFWAVANYRGETLPVTEVWEGAILPDEVDTLFKSGGELADLGEVYVLDQSLR